MRWGAVVKGAADTSTKAAFRDVTKGTLAQQAGKRTPAIALTAYVRVEDRARVLQAGYDRFVPKPVESSELLATLASLVSEEE